MTNSDSKYAVLPTVKVKESVKDYLYQSCKNLGINYSSLLNILVNKWLKGEIDINLKPAAKLISKIKLEENNEVLNLNIEKLPEGYYLATSPDVHGLLAEAKTIDETVNIAKSIAKELKELRRKKEKDKSKKKDRGGYC